MAKQRSGDVTQDMLWRPYPRRLAGERGFTLIELLVVLVILAVLIAIAVPSYLGFRERAANRAAQSNLRATLPAAEAYYSDNKTYVGMDAAALRLIDAGLSPSISVVSATSTNYCLTETISDATWSLRGPGTPAPGYYPNATCS
jgi:prepilin-type N-terminal cleavage/methylation domain-containing protein